MPKISETEAAALNSGTSSIDKDLFIGKLDINDIVKKYNVSLSYYEQNFINTKTTQLCQLLNTYEIEKKQDLPNNVWQYIKSNKFMGISINKQFNGLNFSQHAHAKIVEKIATRNPAADIIYYFLYRSQVNFHG